MSGVWPLPNAGSIRLVPCGFRRRHQEIFQGHDNLRQRSGVKSGVALERFPLPRFLDVLCKGCRQAVRRLPRYSGSAAREGRRDRLREPGPIEIESKPPDPDAVARIDALLPEASEDWKLK